MKPYKIENVVRPTTVVKSPRLEKALGIDAILVSEAFQYTGSFKFRAAYNVAHSVPNDHLITSSSGNFGQALAYASQLLKKRCTVVMPATSAKVKIDAVRGYGAEVELLDTTKKSRAERLGELQEQHPKAYIASPYNDPLVIQGNASLGREIAELDVDYVIVPVGGGGLISGIITGIRESGSKIKVVGAEPLMANDAARSLRQGSIYKWDYEPQTIADGARTVSLGTYNWEIIKGAVETIIEVPEDGITEATKLLFTHANLKAEPTGALSTGALLTEPEMFSRYKVCCVVSGGNVDPDLYRKIIE